MVQNSTLISSNLLHELRALHGSKFSLSGSNLLHELRALHGSKFSLSGSNLLHELRALHGSKSYSYWFKPHNTDFATATHNPL